MAEHFTYQDRQRAICLTALAYYLNGTSQQYDSVNLSYLPEAEGGNKRQNAYISPEEATAQRTVYTVCSSFGFEVYYNALGYELLGKRAINTTTHQFADAPEEIVVFRENFEEPTMPRKEAMERIRKLLEPGDGVVVRKKNGTGHFMLYAGDIDGDGVPKLIHSTGFEGGKYNISTGEDKVEPHGDIRKDPAEALLFTDGTPSHYLMKDDMTGVAVLRPLRGEAGKLPLPEASKARLRFPALKVDRLCSAGYYGSVPCGGELIYTVEITNHSKHTYPDIPVMQTIPYGAELLNARRAKIAGRSLLWSIDLAPGETKSLSFTVKALAEPGQTLSLNGGTAAGLPLPALHTRVSRAEPEASKLSKVRSCRKTVEAKASRGIAFAAAVYRAALGLELELPPAEAFFNDLFDPMEGTSVPAYFPHVKNRELEAMTIREYFGGRLIVTPSSNERVLDLRTKDLEPGDILLFSKGAPLEANFDAWIYTGKELIGMKNGRLTTVSEKEFVALHTKDFFLGLRPLQILVPAEQEAE